MRSVAIFASVLALAAKALAQDATPGYAVVSAPSEGEVVPSGKTYTIKWSAGKFDGPATLALMGGKSPSTLVILDTIATGVDVEDESYSWAVPCSLGEDKTYGIKIADVATEGATFQYSFPFEIKGPSCDSEDSSSSSSSAPATTTHSATGYPTGYPTKKPTVTSTPTPSSYPVETSSSSRSHSTSSTSTSVSTSAESSSTVVSTPTTLSTFTTPVVIVTETMTPTATGSSSGVPATSTTASTPIPTAGAARAGAGFALGLFAAALAL